jgi:c-di-GMP-binding flagellar brake protein YcgR
MREKRSSQRIVFVANGVLQCRHQRFPCHVENISRNGALVGVEDVACELTCQEGRCVLSLPQGLNVPAVDLSAEVVHSGFGLVGLRFVELDAAQEKSLAEIVRKVSHEETPAEKNFSRLYTRLGINADKGR